MCYKKLDSIVGTNDMEAIRVGDNAECVDMKENEVYGLHLTVDTKASNANDHITCDPTYEVV